MEERICEGQIRSLMPERMTSPDLTGYITEGQIILSRDLRVYRPSPINVSRLKDKGSGEARLGRPCGDDTPRKTSQELAATEVCNFDKLYVKLQTALVKISGTIRTIEGIWIGWELLSILPRTEA